MTARGEPLAADVRAWMDANRRGHAAAAEHFRALGFDVTAERARELYREAGQAKRPQGAQEREPPRQDAQGPIAPQPAETPKRRTGRPRKAPQPGQVRDHTAPAPTALADPPGAAVPDEPLQFPATVPKPDPAKMDEEDLLAAQLNHLWLSFYAAAPRDVSSISNQIQQVTSRLNEVRTAKAQAQASHLSTEQRLQRLAEQAAAWPDAVLEIPVRAYLLRKRLGLMDTRTGQRIDRLVFEDDEP
jgi:hypothetical protein